MCAALLAWQVPAHAQPDAAVVDAKRMAALSKWRAAVPRGTGLWPARRLSPPGLRTHTVYWPASRPRSAGPLPIVVFGNGGCRNTSLPFAGFLAEIASHGFFVVAVGSDDVPILAAPGSFTARTKSGRLYMDRDPSALTAGLDWALAENKRPGSPYRARLSSTAIAYAGQSCGGLQALDVSVDPRTKTTLVLNSGYWVTRPPVDGIERPQPAWSQFHAPIAFFDGGPDDMAHPNMAANFEQGRGRVPMFKASLPTVGHSGAYAVPDPRWVRVVIDWLDWQLKGDARAARSFLGPDCRLCRDPDWTGIAQHGLAAGPDKTLR